MKYLTAILFFLLAAVIPAKTQELIAKVDINTQKLQGQEADLFPTLQELLTTYINENKWTDATFSPAEKINCNFSIIINEALSSSSFKGEIQIQATRPVYNSAYTTNSFNHRDVSLEFEYQPGMNLEWNETSVSNNLLAVVTFYIYVILGIDFDSFAPMGGSLYFQQAMNIVNMSQSLGATGWGSFQDPLNRHAIATAFTDERMKTYRQMWYDYHRKGLDEMVANPDRGRMTIITALKQLDGIKSSQSGTCLLALFSAAKLDEVASIYSKANSTEKQEGYKFLSNLFPAETTRLESMKR